MTNAEHRAAAERVLETLPDLWMNPTTRQSAATEALAHAVLSTATVVLDPIPAQEGYQLQQSLDPPATLDP